MGKHHIIITGTGRAGTTFLVQLYTALGFDTGFPDPYSSIFENCNAGMEWDIRMPDAPYIVKSPWLCDFLDDEVEHNGLKINHAIVPVRDLGAAAASRRDVARRSDPAKFPEGIPGGLWHTQDPSKQEAVLAFQLSRLIVTLGKHDIPLTLLYFPRLVADPDYLFAKLCPTMPGVTSYQFKIAFAEIVRPELVHTFDETT